MGTYWTDREVRSHLRAGSDSSWWRIRKAWDADPQAPKPIMLGRSRRWRPEQIDDFLTNNPA
jgi:predicted DNA-binding transcriptional regulator AlpA